MSKTKRSASSSSFSSGQKTSPKKTKIDDFLDKINEWLLLGQDIEKKRKENPLKYTIENGSYKINGNPCKCNLCGKFYTNIQYKYFKLEFHNQLLHDITHDIISTSVKDWLIAYPVPKIIEKANNNNYEIDGYTKYIVNQILQEFSEAEKEMETTYTIKAILLFQEWDNLAKEIETKGGCDYVIKNGYFTLIKAACNCHTCGKRVNNIHYEYHNLTFHHMSIHDALEHKVLNSHMRQLTAYKVPVMIPRMIPNPELVSDKQCDKVEILQSWDTLGNEIDSKGGSDYAIKNGTFSLIRSSYKCIICDESISNVRYKYRDISFHQINIHDALKHDKWNHSIEKLVMLDPVPKLVPKMVLNPELRDRF